MNIAGLCLVLAFTSDDVPSEERVATPAEPIPSCGIAATFSWLVATGHSVPLHEIETQFAAARTDFDPSAVSVAEVRRCLAHFGHAVDAVCMTCTDPIHVPTPAILYFRPGRWPRAASQTVGHFVTLLRVEDDETVILDWTAKSPNSLVRVPRNEIGRLWDGEALIVAESRLRGVRTALLVTVAGLLLLTWTRVQSARRAGGIGGPKNSVWSTLAIPLLGIVGCGSSTSAQPDIRPVLTFEKPLHDAGEVPAGRMIEHEFRFGVWNEGAVRISGIETACGCVTVDKELLNRDLAPGSQQTLNVLVRPDDDSAVVTRLIRLQTTPSTAAPITVGVRYRRQDPPRIHPRIVQCTIDPEMFPTADLSITYRRAPDRATIAFDPKFFSATHFRVGRVETKQETVVIDPKQGRHVVVETTSVRLEGTTRLTCGEHTGVAQLRFTDGSTQTIDTSILVRHPLTPQHRRIFLGVLQPGQAWSRSIVCQATNSLQSRVASVRSVDGTVLPVLTEDLRLELSGTAPQTFGRFETAVEINFAPTSIPPLQIPVSGVVRPRKN